MVISLFAGNLQIYLRKSWKLEIMPSIQSTRHLNLLNFSIREFIWLCRIVEKKMAEKLANNENPLKRKFSPWYTWHS